MLTQRRLLTAAMAGGSTMLLSPRARAQLDPGIDVWAEYLFQFNDSNTTTFATVILVNTTQFSGFTTGTEYWYVNLGSLTRAALQPQRLRDTYGSSPAPVAPKYSGGMQAFTLAESPGGWGSGGRRIRFRRLPLLLLGPFGGRPAGRHRLRRRGDTAASSPGTRCSRAARPPTSRRAGTCRPRAGACPCRPGTRATTSARRPGASHRRRPMPVAARARAIPEPHGRTARGDGARPGTAADDEEIAFTREGLVLRGQSREPTIEGPSRLHRLTHQSRELPARPRTPSGLSSSG